MVAYEFYWPDPKGDTRQFAILATFFWFNGIKNSLKVEGRNENILDRNDGCYFCFGNPDSRTNLRFRESGFFLSGKYELHFLKDLS